MMLIDKEEYTSKTGIARVIAKQYAECEKRLHTEKEVEAARSELLNLATNMKVYHIAAIVLKGEYGMNVTFARKAE